MPTRQMISMLILVLFSLPLYAESHVAADSLLYIISPSDGETVTSPVTVKFGLKGMGVAPAGVNKEKTGHHHLLIDVNKLPAMDRPVPSDENHRHFGGGQTEATIDLPLGEHTLQLLLGDMYHIPHKPPVISKKITIKVI